METEMSNAPSANFSPEEISQLGEKIYFNELRATLEPEHKGEYLILDVETKKYVTDPDKLAAIQKAEKELGKHLFYIIQIGSVQRPTANFKKQVYAWQL